LFKSIGMGVLALALAACGAPKPRPAVPSPAAAPPAAPAAGRTWAIDADRSELRILVYRAGPLARFGHNHVIVNRSLHGTLELEPPSGESALRLTVPVAASVVDDAEARREEGGDFAAEVPDDAKSATLRNMLSAAVLDADEFPTITLTGFAAVPAADDPVGRDPQQVTARVAIGVAGHETTIEVPVTLHNDAQRLTASGTLDLRQSSLGLTPYSLMLGALQVQDAMMIKFTFVAGL